MSPELALVDPVLRADAVRSLPRLEPFDFLRFDGAPRRHPDLDRFAFLAAYGDAGTFERDAPLPVAALAYGVASLAAFVPFGAVVFAGVATLVVLLSLVG